MSRFYIYEEEMDGRWWKLAEIGDAEDRKAALDEYFEIHKVPEDEQWRYAARDADKVDEAEAWLKEEGYKSWDEYGKDMASAHPSRPIEL